MAFKGYASPGQFRARKAQDSTQKLKQRNDAARRGMRAAYDQQQANLSAVTSVIGQSQQYEARNRQEIFNLDEKNKEAIRDQYVSNFQQETTNIERENKKALETMKMIGDLSLTAASYGVEFAQKREEGMRTAYAQAVYQSGITAKEAIEVTKLDTLQGSEVLDNNSVVGKLLQRGVSMEMLEYIRKVGGGGGNRYLESKALMQNTLAQAPLAFEELKAKKYDG